MKNSEKIIWDLCGGSGKWSEPYKKAGYQVLIITLPEYDVLTWDSENEPYGVLAAPPCNCFCRPGARWWRQMDADGKTEHAIRVFRKCWELCQRALQFWALENPPGRHMKLMPELPRPSYQFSPYLFGHPWEKQTYLWGKFNLFFPNNIVKPIPTVRAPSGHTYGKISSLGSSSAERAFTPEGFAQAFFNANK